MLITEQTNQKQSGIAPRGSSIWSCAYNVPQILKIQITAEAGDNGRKVGLTQTLLTSTRRANYDTGGSLTITPRAGLPCLDGEETLIPWYNQDCKPVTLSTSQPQTLTMQDQPNAQVPNLLYDASNVMRYINTFTVSEEFLLTLYEQSTSSLIKQWKWSYNYVLVRTGESAYATPTVQSHNETVFVVQSPVNPNIKLVGPVATENPVTTIAPAGWHEGQT
ncbi:hypothetical protein GP486_001044 [Trichoglossum hirsutum]|uniref:Uncharacterized protein n=1 Tax=Trichoglossum hirsutum TaxID=265104 RepID=A0A9P8LHX3_9PEZI|nr:hypothetical protein GP486_001044 [Trichoglossum hirsutum]